MGIDEGEEVQANGIRNIFNNIIAEHFPNLEKEIPIQVQEPIRIQNGLDLNESLKSMLYLNIILYYIKHRELGKNIESCKGEAPIYL
jgi:hypothetical protein